MNQLSIPTKSFSSYINGWKNCTEQLSEQHELQLFKEMRDGNKKSAETIALYHVRFVAGIVRGWCGSNYAKYEDAMSHGIIGMLKALYNYKYEHNSRFVIYAYPYIKAEVMDYFISMSSTIKIATTKEQRKLFFNIPKLRKSINHLTHEEAAYIAEQTNTTIEQVFDMNARMQPTGRIYQYNDDGEEQYIDIEGGVCPTEYIECEEHENNMFKVIEACEQLDERTCDIVKSRWLSTEPLTLAELGAKYDISQERVRQIETVGLKKLQKVIGTNPFH